MSDVKKVEVTKISSETTVSTPAPAKEEKKAATKRKRASTPKKEKAKDKDGKEETKAPKKKRAKKEGEGGAKPKASDKKEYPGSKLLMGPDLGPCKSPFDTTVFTRVHKPLPGGGVVVLENSKSEPLIILWPNLWNEKQARENYAALEKLAWKQEMSDIPAKDNKRKQIEKTYLTFTSSKDSKQFPLRKDTIDGKPFPPAVVEVLQKALTAAGSKQEPNYLLALRFQTVNDKRANKTDILHERPIREKSLQQGTSTFHLFFGQSRWETFRYPKPRRGKNEKKNSERRPARFPVLSLETQNGTLIEVRPQAQDMLVYQIAKDLKDLSVNVDFPALVQLQFGTADLQKIATAAAKTDAASKKEKKTAAAPAAAPPATAAA